MAERLGPDAGAPTSTSCMASPAQAEGWGSFTLGVADTTPLEMANAYATVAADGMYCEPLPVLSITRPGRHSRLPTPRARGAGRRAALPPGGQPGRGPGRDRRGPLRHRVRRGRAAAAAAGPPRRGVYGIVGRPVAGKTGTTDDTRAAWFVGFTPELAAASFIADPDNPHNAVGGGRSQQSVNRWRRPCATRYAANRSAEFTPPSDDDRALSVFSRAPCCSSSPAGAPC